MSEVTNWARGVFKATAAILQGFCQLFGRLIDHDICLHYLEDVEHLDAFISSLKRSFVKIWLF
jgi:hypothetical protein